MSKTEFLNWTIELTNAIRDGDEETGFLYLRKISEYVDVMTRRLILIRAEARYTEKTEGAPAFIYRDRASEIVKIVDGESPQLKKRIRGDGRAEHLDEETIERHQSMKPY